jgi:hypothetical protein
MSTPDPIEAYLKELRRRLRWRRGGRRMAEEVEDHLREIIADEQQRGLDATEARSSAIRQIGPLSAFLRRHRYIRPLAAAAIGVTAVAVGVALVAIRSDRHTPNDALPRRLVRREMVALREETSMYHRPATLAGAVRFAGFPVYRPEDALGSDAAIAAVWESRPDGPEVTILYRSALLVTVQRWDLRGETATSGIEKLAAQFHSDHARFAWIEGSPAAEVPSGPIMPILGYGTPLDQFGQPATVWIVKRGVFVTIQRWGPHTLPGAIAAARSLRAGLPAGGGI